MSYNLPKPYLVVYYKRSIPQLAHVTAKSSNSAIEQTIERCGLDGSELVYCFSQSEVDEAELRIHNFYGRID